jgi:hypothetical protein
VSELYDVVALPNIIRPSMIGFRNQEIRRTVSRRGMSNALPGPRAYRHRLSLIGG